MDILRELLGATAIYDTTLIVLFVPSRDRTGRAIPQTHWTHAGLDLLATLFGGATSMPPGIGVWRNDQEGGRLDREEVVTVTLFAPTEALNAKALRRLGAFVTQLGRETNQACVALVVGNKLCLFEFDAASKKLAA